MNYKKLFITGLVLICIIIITMIFIFNNQSKTPEVNNKSEIPDIKDQPKTEEPNSLPPDKLIGTWNAISEEVKGEINTELEDYSITFNQNSYNSTISGVKESGNYKLEQDKIIFYQQEEDLMKSGSFLQAYGELKNNQLILTFPQYPKIVIYEK